mgnify:CR=1 FL=1
MAWSSGRIGRIRKKNSFAQSIISRWREVDEAGFLASEFVEWEAE